LFKLILDILASRFKKQRRKPKRGPAATDQRASPAYAASAPSSHDLSFTAFINIAVSNFSGASDRDRPHAIGDKAEQAYRRSDAPEKRCRLMEASAAYCEPKTTETYYNCVSRCVQATAKVRPALAAMYLTVKS
jgi:hypothetical protein